MEGRKGDARVHFCLLSGSLGRGSHIASLPTALALAGFLTMGRGGARDSRPCCLFASCIAASLRTGRQKVPWTVRSG